MHLTNFGTKLSQKTGILQLMDDLGKAMSQGGMLMLGGGNPAHIPQVQKIFHNQLQQILNQPKRFNAMIGNYDTPEGSTQLRQALAQMFKHQYKWNITEKNIILTHGSQQGAFNLINMLAGTTPQGKKKKILFPITPEYIGYADQGIEEDFCTAIKPKITMLDQHTFKYNVDFDNLKITPNIGAICISRPTNPTGNVITDQEVHQLAKLAKKHHIPLILDNAYGVPFPGITFTQATPIWNQDIILCMSLSKCGLPGVRTGIIIANEKTIQILSSINAITTLAPNNVGAEIFTPLIKSQQILDISNNIIQPFYQKKSQQAITWIHQYMKNLPYAIHKAEGALFLWLWFQDLPITTLQLYQRLKKRKVIIVPGEYFFPGLKENWPHKQQCIRLTYAQNNKTVEQGIKIIAEEVAKAYEK
jgi:valine--pyruvate aminotransferase